MLKHKNKPTTNKPNTPFITSTLQQTTNTHLKFNIKKTIIITQHLYKTNYITYIHTNSTNLNQNTINIIHNYINNNFNKKYLPKNPNQYTNKKNSQKTHKTIHPSNINIITKSLKNIKTNTQKLYQLI